VVAGGEVENPYPVGSEPGEAQPEGGFELVPFVGVVRALRGVSGGDGELLCRPQVAEHLFAAPAAVVVCGIQVLVAGIGVHGQHGGGGFGVVDTRAVASVAQRHRSENDVRDRWTFGSYAYTTDRRLDAVLCHELWANS
jgi:hypothetical protein